MTVQTVLDYLNARAPFDTQADFDNSGLLLGAGDREVQRILVALDCTERVAEEAEDLGAELLVTHHPLMFSARKRLTEDEGEGRLLCRLIRDRVSLIACHTCLDKAAGGINDVLAEKCGLIRVDGAEYVRVGDLPVPMTGRALAERLSAALDTPVRIMGDPTLLIRRLGVSSGAGSDGWEQAAQAGAEAFLSGEIRHHHALAMSDAGLLALEAGHYATEAPGIFALADALQKHLNALQYDVCVSKSQAAAYAGPTRR